MSWFRRSSRAPSVSRPHSPASLNQPHQNPTDQQHQRDMSKSLSWLDERCIERQEPEEFFHDPDHVRHYKEEAQFLSIMSEWEIIEHPPQSNYFSADFEEELLQQRTQLPISSLEDINHRDTTDMVKDKESKAEAKSKPKRKRKFLELLFVDNIQTGIALPQDENESPQRAPSSPTAVLCKKSRKSNSTNSIAIPSTIVATCPQQVLKDCRINRKQLKTEALASSIMGAIGKCPAGEDSMPGPLINEPDQCHPGHPRNKMSIQSSGPGDSLRAYTLQLAQDPSSTFARNIENFICCTKESREAAPQVVMRNMRQFMSGMKNYLVKHGEGKFHAELETARARLKSDEFLNLDAMLETVMHQLVVLPLREHLYGIFVDHYQRSEDIQLLAQNVRYACEREAADFGIRPTVTPPSQAALRLIANLLWRLQEAELPLDKLELFLCVISTVFDATGCPRGQQLGADDFLPVLVYVVAKCGFVGAEIEAEFMWGLLQPTLLNGEPGYYLTALCSAVQVLKTFMASEGESGSGSLDWRSSCLPACSSVLRVIIPDECNGSLQTRTLPVRPHTTTREVCRIIAHKARITNPQDYALFKLVDGEETLLTDAECPQDARLAAKGKHCMLAYKRIDAKIAWPTAQLAGH
uniref:Isoform 9 of Protein sprint n=1 Tax=Drosophila melanogaster TaxID=7227 RepID=Q8MQW8-9|nr:sprint, isoform Q [Drosophila melanogaster]AGB95263.1 sprint, isoform Q [Drosophila melanogaster]|eukprot:NP_001259420.1 sprint, isoform Q [Drosophila melanogaster]